MAEEIAKNNNAYDQRVNENVTEIEAEAGEGMASTDRGLLDFMKKKEDEKPQATEEVIAIEFGDKVKVSDTAEVCGSKQEEEKKLHGLVEKLHRSDSSSSCSSDEEGDEEEEKKKKKEKKGLKDKIKEKVEGVYDHKEKEEDTNVPIEKYSEDVDNQEKKGQQGFLDKIKEKISGFHSKNGDN